MTVNKVIWLAFMYIAAMVVCYTLQSNAIGGTMIDTINAMTSIQIISEANTTIFGVFNNVIAYFTAFFNILTFNYSFFAGNWQIVRIILMAIPMGCIFGIIQLVITRKTS